MRTYKKNTISIFTMTAIILLTILNSNARAQFSADVLPTDDALLFNLKSDIPELTEIYRLRDSGQHERALHLLALYLKEKAAARYYFSWKNFKPRFENYCQSFPKNRAEHFELASQQMSEYLPETSWILPFNNLKGKEVTPYELRHLARQQKAFDIAMVYYYSNEEQQYLDYFLKQVASLNRAFDANAYDDAGNGVYERFRAGKRIHNWLFCHNAFLASTNYVSESQLLLVKTFLHHGAQLQKRTRKYSSGNHHTKGLVALFEIGVFLLDFNQSDQWIEQALEGIEQHIQREVNSDGFQFERSVHYHIGDIENYFRVYQLAKLNGISLPENFERQFYKMFEALVKLAQPNKRLPVLQDDTDSPRDENNVIDDVMTIGTLLFEEPAFRYFSTNKIPSSLYWLLRNDQLQLISNIKPSQPKFGSIALNETGYYCLRGGWQENDLYLTISTGLAKEKPDHQHGDALGIVGYANGHEILPNYQVKYNEVDYPFWKNSWAKNVALVDSILLGQNWQPNAGGSGFGKWRDLPSTQVLDWKNTEDFDYFKGTHNAYEPIQVDYFREVLFVKNKFWIVHDVFFSRRQHLYQQVWQGIYSISDKMHAVSKFKDGSGLEIFQLSSGIDNVKAQIFRKKGNVVFSANDKKKFEYTTLLYPFRPGTDLNLKHDSGNNRFVIGNWEIVTNEKQEEINFGAITTDARLLISDQASTMILFDSSFIKGAVDRIQNGEIGLIFLECVNCVWKVVKN